MYYNLQRGLAYAEIISAFTFAYFTMYTREYLRLRIDDNSTLYTYDQSDGNTIINESLIINTVLRSFVIW